MVRHQVVEHELFQRDDHFVGGFDRATDRQFDLDRQRRPVVRREKDIRDKPEPLQSHEKHAAGHQQNQHRSFQCTDDDAPVSRIKAAGILLLRLLYFHERDTKYRNDRQCNNP